MAMKIDHWGTFIHEKVKFYIEPDSELSPLCPFDREGLKLPCPHSGLNQKTAKKWEKAMFIPDKTLGSKSLEKLIPEGLYVRQGLTFVYAGLMPTNKRLLYLLSLTNAVPLMIYGLRLTHDYETIFQIARGSMIRPVYISGDPEIPVPLDIKVKGRTRKMGEKL